MTKTPPKDIPSSESIRKELRETLTPEIKAKLDKLIEFWSSHGIDYTKFELDKKKAYPNYDQYMNVPRQRDVKKWLEAVQNIYRMEKSGHTRVASIRQVTTGWQITETFDFLNWLRFYEGGAHLKYKMAQLWYENGAPGYFLHIKPDPAKEPEPQVAGKDIDFAREEASLSAEKRDKIEKQRNKIIGRLDSAEKLLRAPDGQLFAGPELDALMEAIYQLKRKIHLVNKLSTSTRLYDDMIVREANVLQREGFSKAADWLYSTAQANNPPPAGTGTLGGINVIPPPAGIDSPSAPLNPGAPGGLPSVGPGMPQNAPAGTGAPEVGPNENSPTNLKGVSTGPEPTAGAGPASVAPDGPAPAGIQGFLSNMDTSKMTTQEDKATAEDDELEVRDAEPFEVQDEDHLMVTEAQAMPGAITDPLTTTPVPTKPAALPDLPEVPPAPKAPKAPRTKGLDDPATETPPEVTEDKVAQPPAGEDGESPIASDFDQKIDAVFSGITIEDVVAKLEDIAKIYKTREVPRQLGVVDMMLDSLGLASYFPSLSEAINKSLESNNYISTRLDDILSRLRGAMSGGAMNLKGDDKERPEVAGVKKNLTDADEKEKRRKQQRKEMEAAELEGGGKEEPEVEIEEDLAPKPPARPPAPPAPAPRPLG